MMRADRVMNKAGAPCLDCKRVTFEMRRICPWCAKARREAEVETVVDEHADDVKEIWVSDIAKAKHDEQ